MKRILIILAAMAAATTAQAQCTGTVYGLSDNYNEATGSGFLAVRELPNGRGAKLAELFNGDTVEITGRKGNWYRVQMEGGSDEGYVSVRWMENACGY